MTTFKWIHRFQVVGDFVFILMHLRGYLCLKCICSLAVLGDHEEFERAVLWLSDNISFDVDARVNLFEVSDLRRISYYLS